jgi:hypothetical protein
VESFGVQPDTIGVTRAHQCPLLNGLFVNAAPAVPLSRTTLLRNCAPEHLSRRGTS